MPTQPKKKISNHSSAALRSSAPSTRTETEFGTFAEQIERGRNARAGI
jgi:hypothetical protein